MYMQLIAAEHECLSNRFYFIDLGTLEFVPQLDSDKGDILFKVAKALDFKRGEVQKMINGMAGGGAPHARFIEYLATTEKELGDILDALEEINEEAYGILNEIIEAKG